MCILGRDSRANLLKTVAIQDLGLTAEVLDYLIEQDDCCWVAFMEERLVGFALVDLTDRCIHAMFVKAGGPEAEVAAQLCLKADQYLNTHPDASC